jgi:hypothetical protein
MSAKASSKQTKNTTPKETKEAKETKEPVTSTSDMEDQDQHSLWNGRLKRDPREAKTVRDIIKLLLQHIVDEDGASEILKLVWGESQEVLDSLITKANKRDKKKVATFQSEGLKKPLTANHLFGKHFKVECDKNGTKFSLKDSSAAWQKLTDKEKNKFKKQAADDKAKYTAEYLKLRTSAINNGQFPEDKPKRPATAFFQYLAEVRPSLTKKHANDEDRKAANAQITTDASAMWNALSDNEKAKYNLAYRKAKVESDEKMEQWTARETSRLKKLGGGEASNAEEVNIESTGKVTKKKGKAVVADVASDADEAGTGTGTETGTETVDDEEEVIVKPVASKSKGKDKAAAPVVKKTNDKKSKTTKVTVDSDQEEVITVDDEPVEEEQEVVVEKPKAKKTTTKTTTKKVKVESSDNDE